MAEPNSASRCSARILRGTSSGIIVARRSPSRSPSTPCLNTANVSPNRMRCAAQNVSASGDGDTPVSTHRPMNSALSPEPGTPERQPVSHGARSNRRSWARPSRISSPMPRRASSRSGSCHNTGISPGRHAGTVSALGSNPASVRRMCANQRFASGDPGVSKWL